MLDIFITGVSWILLTYIVGVTAMLSTAMLSTAMLLWSSVMNIWALKRFYCLLAVGLRETAEIRKDRYLRWG